MENHCHPRHRADRFIGNPTEWALRCSRSSMPPAAALAARCGFLLSPSYTEAFQRLGLYCQEPRKLMERPRCSIHPRNWNFESISLQQTVRLSPGFASVRGQSPGFQPLCGPFRAVVVGRDADASLQDGHHALAGCPSGEDSGSGGVSSSMRRCEDGIGILIAESGEQEGDLPPEKWTRGYAASASACCGVM